jgi:hypothetical protein
LKPPSGIGRRKRNRASASHHVASPSVNRRTKGYSRSKPFGALNLEPASADPPAEANLSEAAMTHWRNTMVDKPETEGAVYVAGWTISGLAVLAAVVAVWLFGI